MKIKNIVPEALLVLDAQYKAGRYLESCVAVSTAVVGHWDEVLPAVMAWEYFAGREEWWGDSSVTDEAYASRRATLEQWAEECGETDV